jgi:hypothetical protein
LPLFSPLSISFVAVSQAQRVLTLVLSLLFSSARVSQVTSKRWSKCSRTLSPTRCYWRRTSKNRRSQLVTFASP